MASIKKLTSRIILRNNDISALENSKICLERGECTLGRLSGENGENYILKIGTGDKTWNELSTNNGQLIVPAENVSGFNLISADLLKKIDTEIERAKTSELTISTELNDKLEFEICRSISSENRIDVSILTLSNLTIPLCVNTVLSTLSVNVELCSLPEDDFLSTYVITQGGIKIGKSINIPKDKVISTAHLVMISGNYEPELTTKYHISSFNVSYADVSYIIAKLDLENPPEYWSIWNAYVGPEGGDGSYIRFTVANAHSVPVYVAVPKLVDTYVGGSTTEISVGITGNVGEIRTIYANILQGSIDEAQLCSSFTNKVRNVISLQKEDRSAIDILSGDELTEGSVKKALKDANYYTDLNVDNEVSNRNTCISSTSCDILKHIDNNCLLLSGGEVSGIIGIKSEDDPEDLRYLIIDNTGLTGNGNSRIYGKCLSIDADILTAKSISTDTASVISSVYYQLNDETYSKRYIGIRSIEGISTEILTWKHPLREDPIYVSSEFLTHSFPLKSGTIALSGESSKIWIDNRKTAGFSDLSIIKLTNDEYELLILEQNCVSNALYILSADYFDAYAKPLKNLTMSGYPIRSEAATKYYVDSRISSYEPTNLSDYYKKTETSSASEIELGVAAASTERYLLKEINTQLSTIVVDETAVEALVAFVDNFSINTIVLSTDEYPLYVYLPLKQGISLSRDFCVRIEVIIAASPTVGFFGLSESIDFESDDSSWSTLEPGVNLFNFTETKR